MQNITRLILVAVVIRALIFIISPISRTLTNPDEERNFEIAQNHINGKGYSVFDKQKQVYIKSAFHGSFPVFLYETVIKHNIGKQAWINFIYLITFLLYIVSIRCFYGTALILMNNNSKYAYYAAALYSFYPSVIYFVGALFFYENIALYGLIIVTFRLLRMIVNSTISKTDYFWIPLISTIILLLRAQLIPVFVLFFSAILFILFLKGSMFNKSFKKGTVTLVIITVLIATIGQIPALVKNKHMFGRAVLSTQYGFEFLQGHNALARGSWYGNWRDTASTFYKYVHSNIPGLDKLDELQESKARQKLGLQWIKNQPLDEIKLLVRKLVIYFLPYNFDVLPGYSWFNPINGVVHLLFLCYLIFNIYKRSFSNNDLILLSIVLATIIISLMFFTVYRVRFYAEPFMIIFAVKFLLQCKSKGEKILLEHNKPYLPA